MSAGQEFKELRKDVKEIFDSMKSVIDGQASEIKGLESAIDVKLASALEEQNQKLDGKMAELKKAMEDYEKRMARKGWLGSGSAGGVKSLGQQFVEAQNFKHSRKAGTFRVDPIKLEGKRNSIIAASKLAPYRRSLDLTSAELGGVVQEFRWDQIVQNPLRPRRIAAMIPTVTVGNTNQVEYPEEVVVHELYTELTAGVIATDTTLPVERTAGFFPGQVITIDNGAGTSETATIAAGRGTGFGVDEDANELNLTAGLGNGYSAGHKVTSEEFAFTPEAKLKPMSRVEYEPKTTNIKTLPTLMNVSKQMLDDFTGLQNLIDARMTEFLELSHERQLLYGNGGAYELDGILNNADIGTILQSAVAGDTKLDVLRRAITLGVLAFFPMDMIVLHPSDWEAIELLKDAEDRYIFAQIQVAPGISTIWRAQVIDTPAIDQGEALVGSFRMGAVRWVRDEITLSMSDQNRDNWEKNMVTLRAEVREGFSVLRPKSFVKVTFDV